MFVLFVLQIQLQIVQSGDRAPDKAPQINREKDWCLHGSVTATTGECICSSHLGYMCVDKSTEAPSCQNGFGISFFHYSCMTCSCAMDERWIERKKTFRMAQRRQQQN